MIPMAPGFFRPTAGGAFFTKMLLHFDGPDDSTTFTDEVTKTWTPQTGAKIDTAQSVFGGSSMTTSGTGGIQTSDSAELEQLGQQWTIEFFVRFTNVSPSTVLFTKRAIPSGVSPIHLSVLGGNVGLYICTDGINYTNITGLGGGGVFTTNTWYHVAIEFLAPYYLMWVDGGNIIAYNSGGSPTLTNNSSPWTIGADGDGTSPLNGWIDEFRYSLGIARYGGTLGSITVPTNPFVVD